MFQFTSVDAQRDKNSLYEELKRLTATTGAGTTEDSPDVSLSSSLPVRRPPQQALFAEDALLPRAASFSRPLVFSSTDTCVARSV